MSVLDDAKKATAKVKRMQEQGATAVQAAISAGQELSRSVSAFSSAYPECILMLMGCLFGLICGLEMEKLSISAFCQMEPTNWCIARHKYRPYSK